MELQKELINMFDQRKSNLKFSEETKCPICQARISPQYVEAVLNTPQKASVMNYCCACQSSFITNYQVVERQRTTASYYDGTLIESVPKYFEEEKFSEALSNLSPQFVKIFNQARAAEAYGLDEVAGIGYRKAVEFLVKDFAIHENPDKEEEIKQLPLAACIKTHIENTIIATLAEKSAWIGNDETHYVRKHIDRDVDDLKRFLQAMVMFVGMTLVAEDAAGIERK